MTTYTRGRTLPPIEPDEHLLAPPVGIATTSEGLDGATSWELARLQVAVSRGAPFADSVFNSSRDAAGNFGERVMEELKRTPLLDALERARAALPDFRQQDDYLLAHGASLMSEASHEIIHTDTLTKIVLAVLSASLVQGTEAMAMDEERAAAGVRVLDEGQRREQIKDACAEVFGWRKCEFCGCNTNAKVRACCQRGKDADGVIGPPAPPVVARVFIEVGQSPRFLLQPTAPVAVKQGMLREGWNDLVPAGVKEPLVLGTPAELATRRIGPADGVEASDEAELRKRIGKLRTALQQLENGAGADVAHAALEDDDAR
jgi:hypothetical protein